MTIGTTAEKIFEIRYDMPCPVLEAELHAQPVIWYIAVRFGCSFSFPCADRMYTPVGGKSPLVVLRASSCSSSKPRGALSVRWGSARACVPRQSPLISPGGAGPAVCRIVPCLAVPVVRASVSQCGCRRLGWPGLCFGGGVSRMARRAELGVKLPCLAAGAGGLAGPSR